MSVEVNDEDYEFDPGFEGAGQKAGLDVFRIEKLQIVRQETVTHGTFYSGDSYIVLQTRPGRGQGRWDIHFWLGKDTTADESGTAAYKTVELDDMLGGSPIQHREVQGHESTTFLSYFKNGIRYLDGGVESGFKKIDPDAFDKRLFHIKGKRNIRVRQVDCSFSSLNLGDVFILDLGRTVYVWVGPNSSKMEKMKGAEVARQIRDDERAGKAFIHIVDQDYQSNAAFFKALGSKDKVFRSAEEGGDDSQYERDSQAEVHLFRVSDATGELVVEEVAEAPLSRKHLDSTDCFILDTGHSGVFAWVGKRCTRNEKRESMKNAMDFVKARGYPDWTPCTTIGEGLEPPSFKQFFVTWPSEQSLMGFTVKDTGKKNFVEETFDVGTMHSRNKKKESVFMPDEGGGKIELWRIENFELSPVDSDTMGQFYSGDCYVMLYTYEIKGKEHYIVYFWQGLTSSQDEKASSAIHATKIDNDDLNGAALQVRVIEGKEPEHFLQLFKGRYVVHFGGHASGFKNINDSDSYDVDGTRLFQIRGDSELNTKATQVAEKAASLNSNDAFLLETPHCSYVWLGKGCSSTERELAKIVGEQLTPDRNLELIDEEQEPEEFWAGLGGKSEYACGTSLQEERPALPPRLFHCSNASGRVIVEEVNQFTQEDLIEDDVMILDTYDEVYVWIGYGSNYIEKKEGLTLAVDYVRTDPSGRDPDTTTILQVKQGLEPLNFTCHFHAWDPYKWSEGKSYEEMKAELGIENTGISLVEEELMKYSKNYPLDILRHRPPPEVDLTKKEQYLTDDDFKSTFGMSKAEFNHMREWRRIDSKKQVGLF